MLVILERMGNTDNQKQFCASCILVEKYKEQIYWNEEIENPFNVCCRKN